MLRYCDNVLDGTFTTGKHVQWAAQRFLDDLANKDADFVMDWEIADYAINCFSDFKHTKGEHLHQDFNLYLFQKFIVANIWGFRRKDDYFRRFQKAFVTLARGNGKSPFAAGCANILAWGDIPEEARAEVYCFATKEEQARIVWEEAILQTKTNADWWRFIESFRNTAVHRENGSILEPKGSDSKGSDGWNIHGAVLDELHAWGRKHMKLFSKIRTALGKRRQSLVIMISTEGDEESQLYIDQWNYADKLLNPSSGITDDSYYAFIATADRYKDCPVCSEAGENPACELCEGTASIEIPIEDEYYWPQANPMLNETETVVKRRTLRNHCLEARVSPLAKKEMRQYYLNQRVTSLSKIVTDEMWALGAGELPGLDGMTCYYGFDWGWRDDLTALSLCFPLEDDRYAFKTWVWVPEECPYSLHEEPWASWIEDGSLIVTPGNTTDVDAIYKVLEEVQLQYEVRSGTYDGNNAREFGSKAENKYGIPSYGMPQTPVKYNNPLRDFKSKLIDGKILHGGSSLLGWCATNVITRKDSYGMIMPSKDKSLSKIDPFCAMVMSFSEANYKQEDGEYEIDVVTF